MAAIDKFPNDPILRALNAAIRTYNWGSPEVSKKAREIITHELPRLLNIKINRDNQYKIYGSVGIGTKAEIPWVAILDKEITKSTSSGYYIAFLFGNHGQSIYMCLGLGWTQFEEAFGRPEGLRKIRQLSDYYGNKLQKSSIFNTGSINLGSTKPLGKGYEKGSVLSRKISFVSMNDQILRGELNEMIHRYSSLKRMVGSSILNIEADTDVSSNDIGEFQTEIVKQTLKPINDRTIEKLMATISDKPPEIKERLLKQITRIRPYADYVKQKKNYICELCGQKPFIQKNGRPYAEADHITPLGGNSKGIDSPENMRCLCAQCHAVITHGSEEEIKTLLINAESLKAGSPKYVH